MKIYGTAKLKNGEWKLEVEPQVAMRIKRMFARVDQSRGTLTIQCTDETSRELEWFAQRYPLDFGTDAEELTRRARAHDRRIEISQQILTGTYTAPAIEMALPPREYQAAAAHLCAMTRSLLLADELGLGKTASALALLARTRALPAVIVCPVHIQKQWQAETWRFLRLEALIAKKGTPPESWPKGRVPDVLIVPYSKLHGWRDVLATVCKSAIFDEAQELRNPGTRQKPSLRYNAAEHLGSAVEYRMGLTGTPIYNYGDEFHAVLDVLAPNALGSRTEFIREWCNNVDQHGRARLKNPKAFGGYLRETGLMLRRTKKDVGRELPAVNRIVQPIECELKKLDEVKTSATELAKILLAQGGSGIEKMKAGGELDYKLRQATGIAKARYVAELVRMLDPESGPVVLFGWHRAVYEIWLEALAEYKPALYTGSESPNQKAEAVQAFIRGDCKVLIMSLRSGSGVDGLQKASSRVVIGELDWSPGAIEQCIGRVYRDGQTEPVFAYYPVADAGSDPVMQDILGLKEAQIAGVRDPDAEDITLKEIDPDHMKKLAEAYLRSAKP